MNCNYIFTSKHNILAICTKPKGHQERNIESFHSGDAVIIQNDEAVN